MSDRKAIVLEPKTQAFVDALTVVEVKGSHATYVSQPHAVAAIIEEDATAKAKAA